MCGPVSTRYSRSKSTSRMRASTSTSCASPFTVTWTLCSFLPAAVNGAVATAISSTSHRARDRLAQRALREHAHDIALVLRRTAQVRHGLGYGRGRSSRRRDDLLVRRLAAERLLRTARPDRRGPGVGEPDARARDLASRVERDLGGDPDDREVTDLPLELEVRAACARPATRLMSMRTAGWARRNFISGIRLCPPARIFPSPPAFPRSAIACATSFAI